MPKKSRANVTSSSKKKTRLWQGLLALLVVAGIISTYILANRSSAGGDDTASEKDPTDLMSASMPLKDHLVLPASPRNPRPSTPDPQSFSDPEVRAAYQAAKNVPEVLEHLSCYCGCFKESSHRSNLDCFHDNHGTVCGLCRAIAIEGEREHKEGIPIAQIKRNIDEKWAPPVTR